MVKNLVYLQTALKLSDIPRLCVEEVLTLLA